MSTDNKELEKQYEYIANQYHNVFVELAKGPDDPKGELQLKREERERKEAEEKEKKTVLPHIL